MPHGQTGSSSEPRVLMLSMRNLRLHVSRCGIYEFEDLIRECEDVDLVSPRGELDVFKVTNRLANKAVRILRSVPSLIGRPITVDRDYELFIFCCQSAQDILLLNSLKGWRERCRVAVCWLDEIWPDDIEDLRPQLSLLSKFDRIVMNFDSSREAVGAITGVPTVRMPFGVDAIKFRSQGADRSIDVVNVGRRSAVTHRALEAAGSSGDFFYYYDTLSSLQMSQTGNHRNLYANIAKRSRYSIVNKAKFNLGGTVNPHDEVGPRFFEGMAAGSVMLGVPPRCRAFTENFDWPDSVIDIPFDCPEIVDVIRALDAEPERLEQIRRTNMANAMARHDWVYRWETILASVGMSPSSRVASRKADLAALSAHVRSGRPHAAPLHPLPSPRPQSEPLERGSDPLAAEG